MIPEYETYLFDADGTLLDTVELIGKSFLNLLAKYKTELLGQKEFSKADVVKYMGIPLRKQLELYFGVLSDKKFDEIHHNYKSYQESIYEDNLSLFPGVQKVLSQLKDQGKKLGIVTSRKLDSARLYTKAMDIFQYFDVLITPEATNKHKPEPEPVLEAMKRLDAHPENTVFIGDALFDIKSGNSAGVDTVFVNWSHNSVSDLDEEPNYTIDEMDDLLGFIE